MSELARTVEALLFLSSEPVSAEELAQATGAGALELAGALLELGEELAPGRRGLVLREVAGGYTLASDPHAEDAARASSPAARHGSLTPAQLETLAIVAYLQPVSRPEIARIRGVNAESPVATLLDRGLISEAGRSEFGAILYKTTGSSEAFDLASLEDLPDPSTLGPDPGEEGELRDRLLAAGDARAGRRRRVARELPARQRPACSHAAVSGASRPPAKGALVQVGEPALEPRDVPDAVAGGVGEAAHVDLIDDRLAPPRALWCAHAGAGVTASCPHAAAMSRPRVRRTVTRTPIPSITERNAAIA